MSTPAVKVLAPEDRIPDPVTKVLQIVNKGTEKNPELIVVKLDLTELKVSVEKGNDKDKAKGKDKGKSKGKDLFIEIINRAFIELAKKEYDLAYAEATSIMKQEVSVLPPIIVEEAMHFVMAQCHEFNLLRKDLKLASENYNAASNFNPYTRADNKNNNLISELVHLGVARCGSKGFGSFGAKGEEGPDPSYAYILYEDVISKTKDQEIFAEASFLSGNQRRSDKENGSILGAYDFFKYAFARNPNHLKALFFMAHYLENPKQPLQAADNKYDSKLLFAKLEDFHKRHPENTEILDCHLQLLNEFSSGLINFGKSDWDRLSKCLLVIKSVFDKPLIVKEVLVFKEEILKAVKELTKRNVLEAYDIMIGVHAPWGLDPNSKLMIEYEKGKRSASREMRASQEKDNAGRVRGASSGTSANDNGRLRGSSNINDNGQVRNGSAVAGDKTTVNENTVVNNGNSNLGLEAKSDADRFVNAGADASRKPPMPETAQWRAEVARKISDAPKIDELAGKSAAAGMSNVAPVSAKAKNLN